MRIGAVMDGAGRPFERVVQDAEGSAAAGFAHVWMSQVLDYDALTALALVGQRVPRIDLGTGVVPVYSRHPQVLAQQALTVQAATGNRLILGIGLSHQIVVEGMWGYSYDRPARYMREYLSALLPMLRGETVSQHGEVVTASTYGPIAVPEVEEPPVLVAALGSTMLGIAGRMTSGTITWMTGVETVARHITPGITKAAEAAGRPAPRIAVSLPVVVTAQPDATRARIDEVFAIYPTLPSYRAMLDKEGAERPSDIAVVGSEEEVAAGLRRLADAGATDLLAALVGGSDERRRTQELLSSIRL